MDIPAELQSDRALTIAGLLVFVIALFAIKRFILVRLKEKARSETSSMSSMYRVLVLSLNTPLTFVIILLVLMLGRSLLALLGIDNEQIPKVIDAVVQAGVIVTVFLFFERFFSYTLARYKNQSTLIKNTSAIAGGAARAILVTLAILIILSTMGGVDNAHYCIPWDYLTSGRSSTTTHARKLFLWYSTCYG